MVKLLDCTLRDGGYACNWTFGNSTILNIYYKLQMSNVDIIELGYLRDYEEYSNDRTSIPNVRDIDRIFNIQKNGDAMLVAMIDYGNCSIEHICQKSETILDGIRLTFKKFMIDDALKFAMQIKELGYKICLQPVSIMDYSDEEMIALLKKINIVHPYAVAIVDTYGLMYHEDMFRFFALMNTYLEHDILIGYHPHNSFQLAYANVIDLIQNAGPRDIIIDATIQGLGKDAGNAATELIAHYINEHIEKHYDISYLLEIMNTELSIISPQPTWGYSLVSFLSASNKCRTEYARALLEKKTLSVKAINTIISRIEPDKRTTAFHKEYMEQLYLEYQSKDVDDTEFVEEFSKNLQEKSILLLAPGSNIVRNQKKIIEFIEKNNPVVISANFPSDGYKADYLFFSNNQRYGRSIFQLDQIKKNDKVIITSNIDEDYNLVRGVLNYSSISFIDQHGILDNALPFLINALIRMNVNKVYLAGFDGFTSAGTGDYKNSMLAIKHADADEINNRIKSYLRSVENDISIVFLTSSLYQEDDRKVWQ